MTLTSLLPTLRDSIPSPFDRDVWPAGTHPTLDDVVVSGVSMLRIVDLCATPCVYTGAAIVPVSGGVASPTESTTVVVARIVDADAGSIRLDATFCAHAPLWREARLLGRVSHAYEEPFTVLDAATGAVTGVVRIPADPRVGDLIAVPCAGCFSVGDVRPGRGR
ncbi:hypothetical protein ACFXP7_04485 [Microbacterium sp. P06]|uniref:hypothetical protein n=1 Tax=Microbacterium sp. P06 TaxID=3366949 RepID=UPI003746C0E6